MALEGPVEGPLKALYERALSGALAQSGEPPRPVMWHSLALLECLQLSDD
jgi:hypothetical protein